MKTAYLYIRVSTDEQADTGYSQRSQDEILRRYCDINNITIKAVYFEDHSAKTFLRPQFNKLLLMLRKHKGIVDLILFTKWDRFSRNAGDAYQMISILNKLGVEPQAIEQPLNLEVPENKMMLAFYLAAPEVENDRRALNVINGMRRAKKEGRWMGPAPIGYKNKISEGGKKYIAPDEVKAPLMRWVFEQIALNRYSTESILNRANEKGLGSSKNNFWNAIRNPVYYGKIKISAYKDEEDQLCTGQHIPLISEALFHQVQQVLTGKKINQRTKIMVDEKFPLRGFIGCIKCPRNLTASTSRGRKLMYSYYHCTPQCGTRYKADDVHEKFLAELSKWKPHPAIKTLYKLILQSTFEENNKSQKMEKEKIKQDLSRYNARLVKARELLMEDSMEPDDYKAIKRECEAAIAQLEAQWKDLVKHQEDIGPMIDRALDLLSNLDEIYKKADVNRKREIIGSIFPEKLQFDGTAYRTTRINEAVRIIYSLGEGFSEIKMGQISSISELSHKVHPLVHFSNHFLHDLKRLAALAA